MSQLGSIELPKISLYGLTPYDKANYTVIVIPEGVTTIGYWAFYDCTGLTSVTIPSSVTIIGDDTFEGCTGLIDIYVKQRKSSLLNNASVPDTCTIHWNSTGSESV